MTVEHTWIHSLSNSVYVCLRVYGGNTYCVTTLISAGQKPELQHCYIKQLSAGAQGFQKGSLGKLLQDYGYLDILHAHDLFPFLCSLPNVVM